MTEQTLGNAEAQQNQESSNQETQQEKMLRQSEVNALIGRAKHDALEQGRQQALAELSKQKTPENAKPEQVNQGQSSLGGMTQLSPEEIENLIDEKARKYSEEKSQQEWANQTAQTFVNKMTEGGKKYEDFQKVVGELNLPSMPELVQLTNHVDNTADVIYDLAKNPYKIANLLSLSQYNPGLAVREIQNLSNSIKHNEASEKDVNPKAPLSQIKPSNFGTDSGEQTIRDLRNQSWAKV